MLKADYFDGRSSRRQGATLSIHGDALHLQGEFGERREALSGLDIAEPMGDAPRAIRFADGAFCEVRDAAALDRMLAGAGIRASAVMRAQSRWTWALASLLGMIAVVAVGYVWALPWLAGVVAPRIPDAFTRSISAAALQGLDGRLLAPSKLPQARQQAIAAKVAALAAAPGALPPHRLLFRAAPAVGPNAFALPNGDVVILDELVALTADDDDIAAVVAHELAHVHYRHGLRQLLQSTVVSFVVGVYFGDISTAAAGLAAVVLESRYSREFESEADAYAARVLQGAGGKVEALARMLGRIEEAHSKHAAAAKGRSGDRSELFSSHPETAARIAALRAIAAP